MFIDMVGRFAAFVAGSFAAVLLLATVIDPDFFIHLEITPHRTILFYLSVFGGILAVARGMIPEENRVFDSEVLMEALVQYTHYLPDEWREQLHSKAVHTQFGELFPLKPATFATELASVVLTPFILWFTLPECAPAIVDFFREFTVHVDGLGYVCSFAVFDFQRHGNVKVRYTLPTLYSPAPCLASIHIVWRTDKGVRRPADVQRRKDGKVFRVIQSGASGMDAGRPDRFALPLTHRGPLCPARLGRSHASSQLQQRRRQRRRRRRHFYDNGPCAGVHPRAARVADRRREAARWGPWHRRRRWLRIWRDVVDDARAVDGDGVSVRDGAERRAGRLGRVNRARAASFHLPTTSIDAGGSPDADTER